MAAQQTQNQSKPLSHIPRILALDGGGVRGLSSLLIVEKLMREVQRIMIDKGQATEKDPVPLPCEYFDLICGTSTGGLIAIMLGRLRMPVDVCIKQYLHFSESVFRLDKNILSIPVGENDAYFSEQPLEAALRKVVLEATRSENTPLADDGDSSCPVFVVTTYGRIADGPLRLFKSYGFDKDQTPIWQAARATSAAPAFFPPARVDIPPPAGWYMDGGVRANNPSWEAMVEAKKHWKTKKCFIVSIGTGVQEPVDFIGKKKTPSTSKTTIATTQDEHPECDPTQNAELNDELQRPDSELHSKSLFDSLKQRYRKVTSKIRGIIQLKSANLQPVTDKALQLTRIPGGIKVAIHIVNALVKLSTSSESTHLRVLEETKSQDESRQFPYFRFNVLRGMNKIGLEEWKRKDEMTDFTRAYLEYPDIKEELRKCAEGLLDPSAFESLPPSHFIVPYERNRFFVGRDSFLEELRDTFQSSSRPDLQHHGRIALFGLGGIGKTEIAREFVYRSQTSYGRIYWISAVTQADLLNGYEKIKERAEIPIAPGLKTVEVAEQVLLWLKRTPNWLLVIDNLDEINVLSTWKLDAPNIMKLLLPEPGPGQHTLITMRNPNTEYICAKGKEVGLFETKDSIALLSSLSNIQILPESEEENDAQQIAKELENLPLAISLAGAYIKQKLGSFAQYREHYAQYRSDVLSWFPEAPPYRCSVATTWNMSFDEIRKKNETAGHLFQLLAFFNPDGILIKFLKAGAKGMDNDLQRLMLNDFKFTEALSSFERFSLIKWDRRSENIKIHRLVQAVVKDEMSKRSKTDLSNFRAMIVDICDGAFPQECGKNRALCREYVSQVMGPLCDPEVSETEKSAKVMEHVGSFLRRDGKFIDSERLLSRSLEMRRRILGPHHPDTLTSMDNLARTYSVLHRTDAESRMKEVVEIRRRILGPKHPDTLRSMQAHIGTYYHDLKRGPEAAAALEELVKEMHKIVGEKDPDTLMAMHNLAVVYSAHDRMGEAEALFKDVLDRRRQILGTKDPDTLSTMHSLAWIYQSEGSRWGNPAMVSAAEVLLKEVVDERRRILGPEHPDTRRSVQNLVRVYLDQRKRGEAVALAAVDQEEKVKEDLQMLGLENDETVRDMELLRDYYQELGRTAEAAVLQEKMGARLATSRAGRASRTSEPSMTSS